MGSAGQEFDTDIASLSGKKHVDSGFYTVMPFAISVLKEERSKNKYNGGTGFFVYSSVHLSTKTFLINNL